MKLFFARHADLVVTTSATASSNAISGFNDAYGLGIQAPSSMTSTSIWVEVAIPTSSDAAFSRLQSGGSDISLSSAQALVISPVPYSQLRLTTTSTEATARTFTVAKVIAV